MPGKSEVVDLTKNVEGFLTTKDGSLLFDLANQVTGRGVIVEIGSWKGKSTIWLASGSQTGRNLSVYAVDHFTGSSEHKKDKDIWTFDEFKRNIDEAGVKDIVVPIVKTSKEASRDFNKPIELLSVDGAHDYQSVKSDFGYWHSKVIEDGIIAFHDCEFEGVSRFLVELVNANSKIKFVRFGGSIACVKKTNSVSKLEILASRQLAKVIKFRGRIGWRKQNASALTKPLYNLIRNLAKFYRHLLTMAA